jgi:hypothetical protein
VNRGKKGEEEANREKERRLRSEAEIVTGEQCHGAKHGMHQSVSSKRNPEEAKPGDEEICHQWSPPLIAKLKHTFQSKHHYDQY